MRCEDVLTELNRTDAAAEPARRAAREHLATCANCRDAAHALAALHADRDLFVPAPSPDAFDRALREAAARHERPWRPAPARRSFWLGAGVGAALAAGITAAVFVFRPVAEPPPARSVPSVTLAISEPRDVSVAVASPEPLDDAEIHVSLSGAIELSGFADQRELRWTTRLERGLNELTLPIVVLGPSGGQVLVEVQHGEKRRSFVVDVRAAGSGPPRAAELGVCAAPCREPASA